MLETAKKNARYIQKIGALEKILPRNMKRYLLPSRILDHIFMEKFNEILL